MPHLQENVRICGVVAFVYRTATIQMKQRQANEHGCGPNGSCLKPFGETKMAKSIFSYFFVRRLHASFDINGLISGQIEVGRGALVRKQHANRKKGWLKLALPSLWQKVKWRGC